MQPHPSYNAVPKWMSYTSHPYPEEFLGFRSAGGILVQANVACAG